MLELGPQGDGVGKLPRIDPALDRLEDAAMDRVGEMVRGEELGDALVGFVIGEQGAQQRLLGLLIGGRKPLRKAQKG